MDVDARLDALLHENERLRGIIAQLEAAFGLDFLAPLALRLTASESRVLGVLMKRDLATKDALMAALYYGRLDDHPDQKIVDVFVCKIRAKLRPFGIAIVTAWGRGWTLPPDARDRIRQLAAGGVDAAAA